MIVKTKIVNPKINTPALKYAKPGDAGIDLTATSFSTTDDGSIIYGTNRAFEIPEGYVGLLFPRSSNRDKDLILSNCVGVIDSQYRGEVFVTYKPLPALRKYLQIKTFSFYGVGERIAQLIILPYPHVEFEEAEELTETERGTNGFGHTGN